MVADGHEVASHSDVHARLDRLSRKALAQDLAQARDSLEQITGLAVWGLRAPNFSIGDAVLDCLAESGYWYDSSCYEFKAHDRYGRLSTTIDADAAVVAVRPGLLELPMSRVAIGPFAVPWSGGGYFRAIPYRLFRWGVAKRKYPPPDHGTRSEEHTSELQSHVNLVCRLLLEKKKTNSN